VAYQLVSVSQLGEICFCIAANDLFSNTGHVVASNNGTGRAFIAANGPLLGDERESKLFKASLGVAPDAVGDELLVSGNGDFSGKRRTGINTVGNAQVLTFGRGYSFVVLPRRVRCLRSALGCRQSRGYRQNGEDGQEKRAHGESSHGRELRQESVGRKDCSRRVREKVVDREKERFGGNLSF